MLLLLLPFVIASETAKMHVVIAAITIDMKNNDFNKINKNIDDDDDDDDDDDEGVGSI